MVSLQAFDIVLCTHKIKRIDVSVFKCRCAHAYVFAYCMQIDISQYTSSVVHTHTHTHTHTDAHEHTVIKRTNTVCRSRWNSRVRADPSLHLLASRGTLATVLTLVIREEITMGTSHYLLINICPLQCLKDLCRHKGANFLMACSCILLLR